ncbi:hypothetical protein F4679DRAFT_555268 [Xylaria curta]|nr:hypothetical protein F4679DRAFT_555268 [Xylaria curta]
MNARIHQYTNGYRHAIRDGNTIRTMIRNSASSQDGRAPDTTVPSADMKSRLNLAVKVR